MVLSGMLHTNINFWYILKNVVNQCFFFFNFLIGKHREEEIKMNKDKIHIFYLFLVLIKKYYQNKVEYLKKKKHYLLKISK